MKIANKAVQSDLSSLRTRKKAVHADLEQKRDVMACVASFPALLWHIVLTCGKALI